MPRIFLKPNSAEFADSKARPQTRHCDMPGCSAAPDYRAPKDRSLKEYYSFCLDHVREYNKAWDFFSGMAAQEVEEFTIRSQYGDRPTWRYDLDGAAEDILRRQAHAFRDFEDAGEPRYKPQNNAHAQTPEFEAMAIMGLEPPVTLEGIKARYKELAKKHHPDLNASCRQSEELLKSINMAYTILKMAYGKFENLL
jgi:hypothetical protein